MARESGVALLMLASGSQIKLELKLWKHNISRGYFTYRCNVFVLHSRVGLTWQKERRRNRVPALY